MPPALERRLLLKLYLRDGSDSVSCRIVQMSEAEPVIVGRASKDPSKSMLSTDSNLNIPNSVVSRSHAQFTYQQKGADHPREYQLFLEDLGSSHGTFLNEKHLDPHVKHEVHYNDHIRFGAKVIRTDAEFSPPFYDVEFTEIEEEGVGHVPGRSYSMPSDLDYSSFAYDDDAEHDVGPIDATDSLESDYGDDSDVDGVSTAAAKIGFEEQEAQNVNGVSMRNQASSWFNQQSYPAVVCRQSSAEPPLLWSKAESTSPSQLSSSQPVSPEQTELPNYSIGPINGVESPASTKSKMISLQQILNQESWPTPQTPTTDRKRKFDAVSTNVAEHYSQLEFEEDFSDEDFEIGYSEEDEEDYEPEVVSARLSPALSAVPEIQSASNVAADSLGTNLSEIAQELKEPQEPEVVTVVPNESLHTTEPPRKRQKLSNIAVGVGAFIAGSVSTVAALASLPDNFFS